YMSPEQIRTPDQIDGRSDMYSLACVLYEMLSGHPPFDPQAEGGEKMVAVMTAHLQQTPPPLRSLNPSVSQELEQIVSKAMAKDRNARFGDCREFAQALSGIGSGPVKSPVKPWKTLVEETDAKPPRPGPIAPPEPAPRRSNQLVKVAGGVAVA